MADEHVVLHKERYQRLLDQLSEKKKHDVVEDEKTGKNNNSHEQNTVEEKKGEHVMLSHPDDLEKQRTRDDVVIASQPSSMEPPAITPDELRQHVKLENNMEPPGVTPKELRRLIGSKNSRVKKNNKKSPQNKKLKKPEMRLSSKETQKQKKRKTLNVVKKNWAVMK